MEQFEAVLIGAGTMGKVHLQAALDSPYISKVYICDDSAEIIKQRQEEFGVESISLDEALKNPRIRLPSSPPQTSCIPHRRCNA